MAFSIRLTEEERKLVDSYAKIHSISVGEAFKKALFEKIEEEMKKENYDDNENLMSAEEFLDFMKKNRRTIPNERRIANKDKFIWAVREISETYEIDSDLIQDDDLDTASLYMNYA